jgi:hypothetical protein
MARTHVPAYDEPIGMTVERIRDAAREALVLWQGDADKAGDVEDAAYYQGGVDTLTNLLFTMTFPSCPEDARECVHGNQVWFGNECGECETHGYKWKDAS